MSTTGDKAAYVRAAQQTRPHTCHWPGCTEQCKPAQSHCRRHWFRLPQSLRARIWRHFRPGQEEDRRPTREYVEVMREVRAWIEQHGGAA